MSEENVELARRAIDAFNRRDIDSFLALCDPDVVFISRHLGLEGGGRTLHGHDGVRTWWESLLGIFPDFSTVLAEVRDHGDVTLRSITCTAMAAGAMSPWSRPTGTSRSGATRR